MKAEQFVTTDYLNLLNEEEAKFIFEHAEKVLKDTLDTNTLIITRLTTLCTVTATLLVALFGFVINRYDTHKTDILFITAVIGIAYLFLVAVILFINIRPSGYFSIGSFPKDFFNNSLINKNNEEYRMISFYVNEIHEYQKRILYNIGVNKTRWLYYKTALIMLVIAPVVFGFSYWLLTIL